MFDFPPLLLFHRASWSVESQHNVSSDVSTSRIAVFLFDFPRRVEKKCCGESFMAGQPTPLTYPPSEIRV